MQNVVMPLPIVCPSVRPYHLVCDDELR